MDIKKRLIFILPLALLVSVFIFSQIYQRARAEQSGSSPESGSTSRLKTASDAITALNYGSTAAGGWGDWGTMWNRVYSAAQGTFNDAKALGLKNGSGTGTANCTSTFGLNCYTQAKGGVDDYNNNQTIPSDSYYKTWTACNSGNSYCQTGRSVAEKQDPNTGLVWSAQISGSSTWFVANNCVAPGGSGSLGATCASNGDPGCICVKNTSPKTGCENYDDGSWRLPYQKELMQSYIDGSWSNLTNPGYNYWSSTTQSGNTQYAWTTSQAGGYTSNPSKTSSYAVRCVR